MAGGGVATLVPAAGAFPRELILASAGSGKTFRISSRLIGLLAAAQPPDAILASTFTRKAAGEILDRVLERLAEAALDPAAAEELAAHAEVAAPASGAAAAPGPDRWGQVLEALVGELHRLNIGTLDAFFMRVARSFSHELGLPPGWRVADDRVWAGIASDALQDVLRRADTGQLVELVRELNRNEVRRSVHDALLRTAGGLLDIQHRLEPSAPEPWHALDAPDGDEVGRAAEALAEAWAALAPPPGARWEKAYAGARDAIRARDWDALLGKGLGAAVLKARDGQDTPTYYGNEIPDDAVAALDSALELARAELAGRLGRQIRAMGRFADLYHEAVDRRQREAAAYRFQDVTRVLGGPDPVGRRPDLYYRLDARTRHVLLDEFQDTSLPQWEALEPMVEELLAGHHGERAAVVVADPKQSIYAWRGAEPGLVLRIGERFGLRRDRLSRSWRSSQVVLDVVNRVFDGIAAAPVLASVDIGPAVARLWTSSFDRHEAARAELSGHVRMAVGPPDAGRGEDRPRLLRAAAELAAELKAAAPGFTIGVLTRTNRAVARLIFELRRLGLRPSEEGGNPLTDSPAVAAILALLRMADHPGDAIARYHLAHSPLGAVVGVHPAEPRDAAAAAAARAAAVAVRRRLLDDGYGPTLARLTDAIRADAGNRDRRRLAQLVELAYRWDDDATLRPTDFVRTVETERVEDAAASDVRVMTVHQAKGLEFDIVVLPELDAPIFKGGGGPPVLAVRDADTGRITAVFPSMNESYRRLFPEVEAAHAVRQAGVLTDALSGLYVAMTRARHALHILVKPDGERGRGTARTTAAIVRDALAPDREAGEGAVLFEYGDPAWFEMMPRRPAPAREEPEHAPGTVAVRTGGPRNRILPRRSPSDLEEGDRVDVADLLRVDALAPARARGTLIHAWFQEIGWIDDAAPDDATLRAIARRAAPGMDPDEVDRLGARFREWLGAPALRRALSRDAHPPGAHVLREWPFARRDGDALVEGVIDRLVLVPGPDGGIVAADVLDYKTGSLDAGDAAALAARADRYRPQLESYRLAVAHAFRLEPGRVATRLAFVAAGVIVDL